MVWEGRAGNRSPIPIRPMICSGKGRMGYSIKEIFYTLQGEGAQAGRAAVFCRFEGRGRPIADRAFGFDA